MIPGCPLGHVARPELRPLDAVGAYVDQFLVPGHVEQDRDQNGTDELDHTADGEV